MMNDEISTLASNSLLAAVQTLRKKAKVNLVSILALRNAFPDMLREDFDAALDVLRELDRVVLQTHDGRHSQLSAAHSEACIYEHGRQFAYVCERERDQDEE